MSAAADGSAAGIAVPFDALRSHGDDGILPAPCDAFGGHGAGGTLCAVCLDNCAGVDDALASWVMERWPYHYLGDTMAAEKCHTVWGQAGGMHRVLKVIRDCGCAG